MDIGGRIENVEVQAKGFKNSEDRGEADIVLAAIFDPGEVIFGNAADEGQLRLTKSLVNPGLYNHFADIRLYHWPMNIYFYRYCQLD